MYLWTEIKTWNCKKENGGLIYRKEKIEIWVGEGATIGAWATIGENLTTNDLNEQFRQNYFRLAPTHKFTKWVTKDRQSPNFDGGNPINYPTGKIIEEKESIVSDRQCDIGLHVLRFGYRPEWAGLCEVNHNYIPLTVEVASEDICFAGLPGNDAKLRVKRLRVLD